MSQGTEIFRGENFLDVESADDSPDVKMVYPTLDLEYLSVRTK
jgi:hypothetical protein